MVRTLEILNDKSDEPYLFTVDKKEHAYSVYDKNIINVMVNEEDTIFNAGEYNIEFINDGNTMVVTPDFFIGDEGIYNAR